MIDMMRSYLLFDDRYLPYTMIGCTRDDENDEPILCKRFISCFPLVEHLIYMAFREERERVIFHKMLTLKVYHKFHKSNFI